jgi:pyruvate formate lyase activating enzyme
MGAFQGESMKEAMFYEKKDDKVQCLLCPHKCLIPEGKRGICGVRENKKGVLYSLIYGETSSICPDPIEKKPLYHFYPGSTALSFGTIGCNLRCRYCQNYSISQTKYGSYPLERITPEEIISKAKKYNCKGIAWTYNEPTIWYEFTYDASKIAKEKNLYTVYVTNGYINEEPLKKIAKYLDAMNIDVKAFRDEFYKNVCSGNLEPVLKTVETAKKFGIHVELTYLIIPEYNDNEKEIKDFCRWTKNNVGSETPVHFSRFYPHYKMGDVAPTSMETMLKAYGIAKKELDYVYLGNVTHDEYENTCCPKCKALLIERIGFSVEKYNLENGKCQKCGNPIPIINR